MKIVVEDSWLVENVVEETGRKTGRLLHDDLHCDLRRGVRVIARLKAKLTTIARGLEDVRVSHTYLFANEFATQPADWRWAAALAPDLTDLLPRDDERVAVIGCGTSYFVAQSYAELRERGGHGTTDAWPASECRLDRGYDRVLLLTRSGTTTEVLEVAERIRGSVPVTSITADHDSPVATVSDPIVLDRVDEKSVVQSRFATTTLALLRASLGHDLAAAADQAQRVVEAGVAFAPAVEADQVTFLGTGWTVGLANEAALKLRETTQAWVESYPAMEYRHGPISIAAPGRVTWAIGDVPDELADQVAGTGAEFVHFADDPLVDVVRVHQVCAVRAENAGLDLDHPRSLTRSVILDRTGTN